jgi:signal transduction histidine kinase
MDAMNHVSIEQLLMPAPDDGTLRQLYEALLDAVEDNVFVLDADCRVIYANAPSLKAGRSGLHIDFDRELFFGKTLTELNYPEEIVWQLAEHVRRAIAGEVVVAELSYPVGVNDVRTYEYRLSPLSVEDSGALVVGIARDVEIQKIDGRSRLALYEDERLARAEAEAAVRIRDEFLSAAAHDLRTPLTAAQGRAQLVLRQLQRQGGLDPDRLRTHINAIQAAITQMANQIAELQDVAFLQIGRPLELNTAPLDITELIRRCVTRMMKGDDPNVTVTLEFAEEPIVAVVDRVRIARVLDNLLSNALKYTPRQKVIAIAVRFAAESGIPGVAVSVTDNGIGIPEKDLPRIFERFQRASNAGAINGIGVGLAGAQQIVHQHGGTISVSSVEGEGSVFSLWLPLEGIEMVRVPIQDDLEG